MTKDRLYFLEKYILGRANEIIKGFLAVNFENAYTEAQNFWISNLATPCTWLRPTNHTYGIGYRLRTEIVPGYKPLVTFSFVVMRLL